MSTRFTPSTPYPVVPVNVTSQMDAEFSYGLVQTGPLTLPHNSLCPSQHGQGGELMMSPGGRLCSSVNVASAISVVKNSAGRLCKVILPVANGANVILIYDNATAASGVVVGVIAPSAPVGVYTFDTPSQNGITVGICAGSPVFTISFY